RCRRARLCWRLGSVACTRRGDDQGGEGGGPRRVRLDRYQAIKDRKSTRLNSSHLGISYAVFCLKKKNQQGPSQGGRRQYACVRSMIALESSRITMRFFCFLFNQPAPPAISTLSLHDALPISLPSSSTVLASRFSGVHSARRRSRRRGWRVSTCAPGPLPGDQRSEEHTSELQSLRHLVCRLLLEKKKSAGTEPRRPPPIRVCSQYDRARVVSYYNALFLFFVQSAGAPRDLHSFPTRRSSDLAAVELDCAGVSVQWRALGAATIKAARVAGLDVCAWTVTRRS